MTNNHMKRNSISLLIRKIQVKIRTKIYLPIRLTKIKKYVDNINISSAVKEISTVRYCWLESR